MYKKKHREKKDADAQDETASRDPDIPFQRPLLQSLHITSHDSQFFFSYSNSSSDFLSHAMSELVEHGLQKCYEWIISPSNLHHHSMTSQKGKTELLL